jgi:hypothetical protein
MNDNNTDGSPPLYDNPYVQELFSILRDNGRDAAGLSALLGHVSEMESFVKRAEDKIAVMKDQLAEMKEIQSHPVKSTLQKAIKSLEHTVSVMKQQIGKLKNEIIGGCESAVLAFKEKGVAALNNLASFFKVKSAMKALNANAQKSAKVCDNAVADINAFAAEYRKIGAAVKNMGRILVGREPVDAKKEAGILAKSIAAPYKAQKALFVKISGLANAATERLENLEARQAVKQAERVLEKKPSLLGNLAVKKEIVAAKKLEIPAPDRAKTAGLEV